MIGGVASLYGHVSMSRSFFLLLDYHIQYIRRRSAVVERETTCLPLGEIEAVVVVGSEGSIALGALALPRLVASAQAIEAEHVETFRQHGVLLLHLQKRYTHYRVRWSTSHRKANVTMFPRSSSTGDKVFSLWEHAPFMLDTSCNFQNAIFKYKH